MDRSTRPVARRRAIRRRDARSALFTIVGCPIRLEGPLTLLIRVARVTEFNIILDAGQDEKGGSVGKLRSRA